MRRGTTPTCTFETDVDLTSAEVLYITFSQNNINKFEKQKDDCTITEDKVEVRLTQTETLLLESDDEGDVDIQIRVRFADGSAIASNIINTNVDEILKGGVI